MARLFERRLSRIEARLRKGGHGGVVLFDLLLEGFSAALGRVGRAGSGGVLLVPAPVTPDAWEALAREQQAQLKRGILQ